MTKENVQKIHEASMKILAKTGMKFIHPDAVKVLQEHGVKMEGNVAYFTEDQIMEWIAKAPHTADLYAADSAYDVSIGEDRSYNAPACTTVMMLDADGTRRRANLDDFTKIVKLYEANPAYKINGGLPLQPNEVPVEWSTLLLHYLCLTLTNKSMWACTGNYEQMEAVIEMTCARFGITTEELMAKPRIMAISNTITPLEFDIKMTETLFTLGKYHQPMTIAPAAMAGTTSPVTLAGTIAMANAEVISTAVLAQMHAPGTPVIYGSATTTADMRSGSIAIGAPEGALCYSYAAQMAKFYGLPCRAGGSLTDAKMPDAQAGYEAMMNYLTCRKSGVNLLYHSAGVLNSYLDFSFEQMMVDFEIIDYVDTLLADIVVDDETVPLDLIDEIGQGGQYLTTMHTIENCRDAVFAPNISVRGPHDDEIHELDRNIAARQEQLLDAYKRPEVDAGVRDQMRAILKEHGIEDETIALLDACE